ncbi:MAG: cellulase family glycosylhydrolase, partial [Leadbetterella sp.]
ADDIKFISDLIDFFFNTYGIDRTRVYVTGHSGGAFMAYHLILSDGTKNKIAAIAPVAASVWGDNTYISNQTTVTNYVPTAIMHVHCTADAAVAPPSVGATYTWPFSIFSTPQCNNPAPITTVINSEIDRLTYCGLGKKIEYLRLKRASLGHGWPTTANSGFNGATEIWNFVKTYTKGSFSGTLADPAVSPLSITIESNQTVILTASACPSNSTYLWKQGSVQVATTGVFVSPALTSNTTYTAYCATSTCQSAGVSVSVTVSTDCPPSKVVTGTISPPPYAANMIFKASDSISIGNMVSPLVLNSSNTNRLALSAGKSVQLKPGLSIQSGAVFKAEIANCASITQTMYIQGRTMYDITGQPFIMRGVNYSLHDDWGFPGADLLTEIEKSKSNTVRLQFYKTPNGSRPIITNIHLDSLLTKCKRLRIMPVVELHDLTCAEDVNRVNTELISWWTDPARVAIFNKHKKYLIINLANEVGRYRWAGYTTTSLNNWKDSYKTAITSIRNAGLDIPIMIDAPDCGTDVKAIVDGGQEIIDHDPKKNVIFSVHSYWAGYNGYTDLTNAINANLPLVFGEIANKQDDYVNNSTSYCHYNLDGTTDPPNNPTNGFQYQTLLTTLKNNNIGWLAWAWIRDGCSYRNMTSNSPTAPYGGFNTLTTYGNDIVNNATYGLFFTAIRASIGAF